jgi:hypothetical protein
MSARRQIIAALSEDSMGGIATHAEQLVDALVADVRNEDAALLRDRAARYPTRRIFAAGLRHGALILAKAAMQRTPDTGFDFFEPGRTYRCGHWTFRVDTITRHPVTRVPRAVGWALTTMTGRWVVTDLGLSDWQLSVWVDVTQGGGR